MPEGDFWQTGGGLVLSPENAAQVFDERATNVILKVTNGTGLTIPQGGVLALPAMVPTILPSDDDFEFARVVAVTLIAPTAADQRCVVFLEEVAAGEVGRAVAVGLAHAKVNVSNAAHTFATTVNGTGQYLASSASSGMPILWKESGTGILWAMVALNGAVSGSGTVNYVTKWTSSSLQTIGNSRIVDNADSDTVSIFSERLQQVSTGSNSNVWTVDSGVVSAIVATANAKVTSITSTQADLSPPVGGSAELFAEMVPWSNLFLIGATPDSGATYKDACYGVIDSAGTLHTGAYGTDPVGNVVKGGVIKTIGAGTGVSDGDKGDITVSSSGTVWTIDNDAVTYAMIQNVSATDKVLGRKTAGAGDVEEIACTSAGRSLIAGASASDQRGTLGLNIGIDVQAWDADLDTIAGTITAAGLAILDDANAAAQRTTLGLVIGTDVQAWDADLDAIAALTGTDTIYYRSGANTWTAVTIGANLSFSSGTLEASAPGTGTVTSVAMTVPSILSVAGSPVTTSGTLAVTLATQTANIVFAGPSSGGAATPAFRSLVSDDIPNLSTAKLTSGTLPVARGGTGIATATAYDVFYYDGSTFGTIAIGASGQVFCVVGGAPAWKGANPCLVYNSANISLTTGTLTLLTFNSEYYDLSGWHSTASNTSRLTVPVDGKYFFWACVQFAANGTGTRILYLRVNGTTYFGMQHNPTTEVAFAHITCVTGMVSLSASDYVEVLAYQNSGSTLNAEQASNYSPNIGGMWIGQAT